MTIIDLLLLVAAIAVGVGIWAAVSKSKRLVIAAGMVGGAALLVLAGMLLALSL